MRTHNLPRNVASAITIALVMALLIGAPAAVQAQADGPDPRQRLDELVDKLNTSGADYGEYVDTVFSDSLRAQIPPEVLVEVMTDLSGRGPWEVGELRREIETGIAVSLHSTSTDEWLAVDLTVDEAAPYQVSGIIMQPSSAPPTAAAGDSYTRDEVATELGAMVDDLVANDRFSGSVLVTDGNDAIYEAATGTANKDYDVPNNIDTKFNLGSMNKMFTAVAIAQLVERGDVSFDDPLSEYLPTFPDRASADKIQIKHLLSHTSGLGSYFNREFMNSSRALYRSVDDLMGLAEDEQLQFEPGTQWAYSNTGFLVLGKVIEVATGQDYHDYIRDHVTGPAGMAHTDAYQLDHVNSNLAVGYDLQEVEGERVWRNNIFLHVIRGGPAGGGYSTVGDLVRFADALRNGTLISRETFAVMASAKPELGSDRYGYGFGIGSDGSVGHNGGFPGVSAELIFWPDRGWTVAVLSNYSGGVAPVVARARRLVAESN